MSTQQGTDGGAPASIRGKSADTARSGAETLTGHQIRTDRPCARCGFNLFGQPIVREAHYDLVVARCPECGQLAALQEYPSLGKWADRWAKLLAACWIVGIVLALGVQFGPTVGFTIGVLQTTAEQAGADIAQHHASWLRGSGDGTDTGYTGSWSEVSETWWAETRDDYRNDPNRVPIFRPETITMYFLLVIVCFSAGVFWSTLALGSSRYGALVIALIPIVLSITLAGAVTSTSSNAAGMLAARDAAAEIYRVPVLLISTGVMLGAVIPGVVLGRKVTRLLVRLALPPRMRGALGILWTRDGLGVPTGGRPRGAGRSDP